ncbi:J domain-containing protein [Sulfurimonas microaerophilic]|uniref:J domain-containing protein n=1 Tax=Sulfurimonas microaerophilic TaxID=3058392 RepID=UPI002714D748|nr:J domain-containing protein [Sulfurimonas sp. hsl 1-7]
MDITLTKQAIQIRLKHDSVNLKPLMYFIENSFKNVKYYSNVTVVNGSSDESIKIRYMIQWAYKIYLKSENRSSEMNYKKLSESIHLPIYVICNDQKQISQTLTMTIEHVDDKVLSVTANQYNSQVIRYFKMAFKNSMSRTLYRKTFRISIRTQHDLLVLKQILSTNMIANTRVTFQTYSLNFKKLNQEQFKNEESALEEKLQKCYKVLNINDNSTAKEIKNNYKKMLRKYHPDRVFSEDTDVVELYTKRFQAIQKAYELIQEHRNVA